MSNHQLWFDIFIINRVISPAFLPLILSPVDFLTSRFSPHVIHTRILSFAPQSVMYKSVSQSCAPQSDH